MSPEGWAPMRLGDVARVIHGFAFSGMTADCPPSNPIVIGIGNFDYSGGFRFSSTTVKRFTGEYPSEYELSPGDLLLAMTCQTWGGEILGIPGRVPDDSETYLHNQRLGRVQITDPESADQGFLFQLARWTEFNRHLVVTASGSKILHTSPGRIEDFEFALPPLHEQRAIAATLGALDDKIESNRRTVDLLSELALATYTEACGEENPRVEIVGDIAAFENRRRVPLSSRERDERAGPYPYFGATGVVGHVDDYLFDEVVVLVGEDGSVVNADGTPVTQYVWGKCWVNNHAHVLRGKGISTELLLLALATADVRPIVTGAVQAKVSMGNLKALRVELPSLDRARSLEPTLGCIYANFRHCAEENATLQSLRDVLLPALLSGRIRVAEEFAEVRSDTQRGETA